MINSKFALAVVIGMVSISSSAFAGLAGIPTVPEPASTGLLLGMALSGLALGRKFWRK